MVLAVGLLVAGCAGSSAQLSPQQFAAQLDSQDKPNRLQEQLLKQAPQLGIVDFKDYKVGPEDTLAVNFLDTDKLNTEVRVNGQGEISLLLVGTVPVADLTPHEVEKKLARLYKEGNYLRNPNITVTVKEYRYQKVAVTGAVNKPDYYSLIGPRTLLEVLGMAGGLSDKAGEVAHIIRANKKSPAGKPASPPQSFSQGTETIIVDLNRLLLKGEVGLNF
ncbi:MAG: polysaccharide biosynthesis/export family protein, partial [Desulfobaccales bacterium]